MWIFVILIIVPFALWGINQYFGPELDVTVATVNGKEVGQREFQESYQRQRHRLQTLLGAKFDVNQLDEGRLKLETVDRMVDEELVVQMGIDHGLRIGDGQLAGIIRAMEAFQDQGKFSQERYEAWLRNQGYFPGSFEYSFRRSLLDAQLHSGVSASSIITDVELDNAMRLQGQKRDFSVLLIPVARFVQTDAVTEQAVAEYFASNRDAFVTPEQVSIAYIELSKEAIAEGLSVDDDELQRRYEAQKSNYLTPERRRASHILLTVPADAAEDVVNATREKAAQLIDRIKQGESFEDLAKAESQDPGSASAGGDLGFFDRGMMVKPFEDAVFAMTEGDLSEPVRSDFGFHVIKLTGIQAGGYKPFSQVKDALRREVRLEKAEQLFFEQAEQFANLVFENPDTLEVAADAMGLTIKEFGPFTQSGGSGLAAEPRVVSAAFSEEVASGNNSEPLELPGNRIVALRVKDRVAASQRDLEEVKADIVAVLSQRQARERAAAMGAEVLAALQNGGDAEVQATQRDLLWQHHAGVQRSATSPNPQVVRRAFQLDRPAGGKVFGGVPLAAGDYAVIALESVKDGTPAGTDANARRDLRRRLERGMGDGIYADLVRSLREKAEVKVFKDRL